MMQHNYNGDIQQNLCSARGARKQNHTAGTQHAGSYQQQHLKTRQSVQRL